MPLNIGHKFSKLEHKIKTKNPVYFSPNVQVQFVPVQVHLPTYSTRDTYGGEFGLNYDDGQEILEDDLGKVQKTLESSKV